MLARMVEMVSTATPESPEDVDMIHDVWLGMSDCERGGLVGNMLGEAPGTP